VMFFMGHSKKGMSALQIHRMLGTGSYETAWYMCTRIRAAMKNSEWAKLTNAPVQLRLPFAERRQWLHIGRMKS
jgi:hypothetical protein